MLPRSARGEDEAAGGGGGASELHHTALLVLGVANAAMTIALVAGAPPPPGLDRNAYFLSLSGLFLAGVAVVYAAAWVSDDPTSGCRRAAAGRKLVYASFVPFAVAAVISVATALLW